LLVLLGLFVAEICHNYQPVKLSALLVILFWIPLLAWHEAGHAVVAALLGWNVGQVVLGMGREVGRFRVGGAVVEIRLIPVEGFVRCVPRNLHLPHLKSACIYFAGPGVELLLALAILLLVGPATLLSQSDDYLIIVWQSLALASTAQAVLNLIPHSTRTPEGEVPNDGLGIIRSFFMSKAYYAEMIGHTYNEQDQDWQAHDPADWWKREK
jgi:membrane-associated protease RseP (regulator of RpoE activity)